MKTDQTTKLSFIEQYDVEQRRKMAMNAEKNRPNSVLVVVQKNRKCHLYPTLTTNLFITNLDRNLYVVETELKKRLQKLMQRSLEKQSLFLNTHNRLLNKDQRMGQIYEGCHNKEDGILYINYSSVDPFG